METIILKDKEVSRIVRSALEREKDIINRSIAKTTTNLKKYEDKYAIPSKEFYKKYLDGKMGDDTEIMLWAAEYQALEKLQNENSRLEGVTIYS